MQKLNDQKVSVVELIIWQILAALCSSFIGFIMFSLIEPFIFGRLLDLSGSILYGLVAAYFLMYIGIAIVSLIGLKEVVTKTQVLIISLLTFPGLVLTMYYFIFSSWHGNWLFQSALLAYPILGLIWGFNKVLLDYQKKRSPPSESPDKGL